MSKPKIPKIEFEHPSVEHKAKEKPALKVQYKKTKKK